MKNKPKSAFNDDAIKQAAIDWCNFIGEDANDERILNAFIMGAKLSLSNEGWIYVK